MARPAKPKLTVVRGFGGAGPDVEHLVEAKLASSGLTLDDAAALKFSWLPGPETKALAESFYALAALKLPYHDLAGKPLRPAPGWEPFFRVRYLQPVPKTPEGKEGRRYDQPAGSGVCAYLPPNVAWTKLLADPGQRLILTEGELKAAKASKEGFPTIGLGGVHSFRHRKLGYSFLPELESITWPKREVFICFDSDLSDNVHVQEALNQLADELIHRGAIVKLLLLPDVYEDGTQKTGLDDLLVHRPVDQLELLLERAPPYAFSKPLWQLNEELAFVRAHQAVVVQATAELLDPKKLTYYYAARVTKTRYEKSGQLVYDTVKIGPAWLDWGQRLDVDDLAYLPGQAPKKVVEHEGKLVYNTWPGWGVEPDPKVSVQPFHDLIGYVFDDNPQHKQWFLRWLAYPLQHPGAKLFTTVMMHSLEQGTGKSLLGYMMGGIYGDNFNEIRQADLDDNFTSWAAKKQFILADDITGSDRRQHLDHVKKLITQKQVVINQKHQKVYSLPDTLNYYWTSNRPNAIFLEDSDRRFFIHEITAPPKPESFYRRLDKWLHEERGAAGLFHYLLALDLGDFHPAGKAPASYAKEQMTRDSRFEHDNWVRDLRAAPDDLLKLNSVPCVRDLFTLRQLRDIFCAWSGQDPERVKTNALGFALREAGFRQVHHGRLIRADGTVDRYYVVRNERKWLAATLEQLQAHLTGPTTASEKSAGGRKY